MNGFELFKQVITGTFDNSRQIEEQKKAGQVTHPLAKHINTICNDRISGLPEGFTGIFVIEESYYTYLDSGRTNILPHLFLFTETDNGQVLLTSYEVPKEYNNKEFVGSNLELRMEFDKLELSRKVKPFPYECREGGEFFAESLSQIGPDMTLYVKELLSKDRYEVTEEMKKGEKILVGFGSPIIYDRIS